MGAGGGGGRGVERERNEQEEEEREKNKRKKERGKKSSRSTTNSNNNKTLVCWSKGNTTPRYISPVPISARLMKYPSLVFHYCSPGSLSSCNLISGGRGCGKMSVENVFCELLIRQPTTSWQNAKHFRLIQT